GKLLLTGVQVMVVDEADRMLDMGFIPDIERIFEMTPFTRQTLFFSATMAPEIERITNKFLSNPDKIEVERQNSTSDTITQILVEHTPKRRDMTAKDKRAILRAIIDRDTALDDNPLRNAIIFCNRKVDVDVVAKSLKKHGYNAEPIHGDLDQSHRTRTLDGFRDGSVTFLVASDVAARGLDIPNVSHVFNYDVPSHAEDYVHRIGRTGRAGKTGIAYSIAVPADGKYLDAIQRLVKADIPRGENPWSPPGHKGDDAPRAQADDKKPARSRTRSRSKPEEVRRTEEAPAATAAPQGRDREPRHRGGRGRGDGGPKVVGLGDHVPSFIEMSFEERRAETA
ncbi:MAG: DEAD/DEAH box helicase, partial [Pseudomonadota bacterium]